MFEKQLWMMSAVCCLTVVICKLTRFSAIILWMTRSFSGVTISDCTAGSSIFSLCILDDKSRGSNFFPANLSLSSSSVRSWSSGPQRQCLQIFLKINQLYILNYTSLRCVVLNLKWHVYKHLFFGWIKKLIYILYIYINKDFIIHWYLFFAI